MQTPGRRNEPQTPMLPVIERRVEAIESSSILNFQKVESIERGQRRVFGRVINQLGALSKNMDDMRNIIRRDIREKQRYFKEEQKILKKDSDNLSGISSALFLGARRGLATALGVLGASQIAEGNTNVGLQNIGGAAALLTPEILEVITGAVINGLALRGLLGGGRGAGAAGLLKNIGGKKGLFLIASLAAALIIPQLVGNQNADKRRSEVAARTIKGKETINQPDVSRFRQILDRFDKILSNIKLSNKKSKRSEIDDKLLEKKGKTPEIKKGEEIGKKIAERNLNSLDLKIEGGESNDVDARSGEDALGEVIIDNTQNNMSDSLTLEGSDNISFQQSLNFANTIESKEDNRTLKNIFPKDFLSTKLDINFSVPSRDEIREKTNVINLSDDNQGDSNNSSNFIGESVSANFVNVSTKFESIDTFDFASSYKTYSVFM
tara:strand:+ start:852 stop:2162 length:1311 start_codon:yes stop_codon:yes gene_type:complete